MKREIKFRIWSKTEKSFILGEFNILQFAIGCVIDSDFRQRTCDSIQDNLIFQEFTGLKDKNGREIYEGDIIKFKNSTKNRLGKIEISPLSGAMAITERYKGYGVYVSLIDISNSEKANNAEYYNLEVIGNIFENPELLKDNS